MLDGVTSAIGIKNYLKRYGINTIDAIKIQYGGREYAIPKSKDNVLNVLVDFSNGKFWMHVHTDHHDRQIGAQKTKSTAFVKTPSNVQQISTQMSPNDIFPQEDIQFISVVDSADYAKQGYTVNDVIQSIFKLDKDKPLRLNKANQGFVVNKLILSYKNHPDFLKRIVMEASPSLQSMYLTITKLIKELRLETTKYGDLTTEQGTEGYEQAQKELALGKKSLDDVRKIGKIGKTEVKRIRTPQGYYKTQTKKENVIKEKKGQSMLVGNLLIQYDSSPLWGRKKYDRYMAFKINPEAHYFCMIWTMGTIQVSKNPFMKGNNPYHLGEIILGTGEGYKKSGGVMDKFKGVLENRHVNLNYIKYVLEKDIKHETVNKQLLDAGYKSKSDAIGFTADDFANVFKNCRIKGLRKDQEWKNVMRAITNTKYHNLVELEKEFEPKGQKSLASTYVKTKYRKIKEATVKDIYPDATESAVGGDPSKVKAIDMLKQVKVPLWDIIMTASGGHKDITNIANLDFYKYVEEKKTHSFETFLRNIAYAIAEKMKDFELKEIEETKEMIEESFKGIF